MGWTAGADVSTGDLITAATWNNYLGATGSLEHIGDTKELWVPVTHWFDASAVVNYPTFGWVPLRDEDDYTFIVYKVPDNWAAIVEAKIIVSPSATQAAANWDIQNVYGATGEDWDNNTETDAASTYNVTDDIFFEVDVSGIMTGIAAGDHGRLYFLVKTDGHGCDVYGLFFKYSL